MGSSLNQNNNSYNRRKFMKLMGAGVSTLAFGSVIDSKSSVSTQLPNIVIIFTDDQGYADLGCYGAKGFTTPNIDRMATEGMRFTDFYVASSVCTPSRAALLTGCYPQRVGLPWVVGPKGPKWVKGRENLGLSNSETTIAKMLKPIGYATACFGKWHVGHLPEFLPTRNGFDEYFGLPYSNDMCPSNEKVWPDLPLMEGEEVVQLNPDQSQLTTWYTEHSMQFIEKNKDRPFFLYVPHSMPHVPLYVSKKFQGKTERGLYGDVIMEIDWSVGQILSKLKQLNLDENTLVIFTSDNGPWLRFGKDAGSAFPLRGPKESTYEGGQRVPCIMRWPGVIPAGSTCQELATTMDILPTIATFTDAALPSVKIDGKNIRSLLENKPDAKTPYDAFFYYMENDLQAIRSGQWKLRFAKFNISSIKDISEMINGNNQKGKKLELYNLKKDIRERTNVVSQYPKVAQRLFQMAQKFDAELKQTSRPVGRVEN